MRALIQTVRQVAVACVLASPAVVVAAECPGAEVPFPAGAPDDFALPAEATFPSPALVSWTQAFWPQPTTRRFDTATYDEALIHTFGGWVGPVCGARLEIRLRGVNAASFNDSIRLELIGGSDQVNAFQYWTVISQATGTWDSESLATVELDLANLPPYVWFPTNILDALDDGSLDLLVEDDTDVDYAVLHVCYCPISVEELSWGRLKAGYARSR